MPHNENKHAAIEPPRDFSFNLLIIGDSHVGKSTLLTRFTTVAKDAEISPGLVQTIGVDFRLRTILIGNDAIKLKIWDTAGQERFRTITRKFYQNAHGHSTDHTLLPALS